MSSSWEHFELLCKSGPDLSLQDHILLQHFYIGINKEYRAYLNTVTPGFKDKPECINTYAPGSSFTHVWTQ
jgi:hypothetical protein